MCALFTVCVSPFVLTVYLWKVQRRKSGTRAGGPGAGGGGEGGGGAEVSGEGV